VASVSNVFRYSKTEVTAIFADIDPEQFVALKDKAEKTLEENDKLLWAFLKQTYNWTGEIDAAFVKTYDDKKQKQWYRNLNAIKEHTLGEIQAAEQELHEAHGDCTYDWNKTYYFEHHRIAQSVLAALLFEGLEDPSKKTGQSSCKAATILTARMLILFSWSRGAPKISGGTVSVIPIGASGPGITRPLIPLAFKAAVASVHPASFFGLCHLFLVQILQFFTWSAIPTTLYI
jgi:hypothetical protein